MEIRMLTEADSEAIATWRYPGRYATYDPDEPVTPEGGSWAVEHEGELVGYCSFGHAARVPGIEEEEGTLDVGYGMRPDLMGRGLGREFVGAILDHATGEFSPGRFRLLILDWNERSQRVAAVLGFRKEDVVRSIEGDFLVMTRELPPQAGARPHRPVAGRQVDPGDVPQLLEAGEPGSPRPRPP
jgi:RimJ/RimL family protein N-acetyltransferase